MLLKPSSPVTECHAASQNRATMDSCEYHASVCTYCKRIRCIFMDDFNNNKVFLYLFGLCGDPLSKGSMKNCANSRIHMEHVLTLGSHSHSRTPTWRQFTAVGVRLWTVGGNKRSWRKVRHEARDLAGRLMEPGTFSLCGAGSKQRLISSLHAGPPLNISPSYDCFNI